MVGVLGMGAQVFGVGLIRIERMKAKGECLRVVQFTS